MALESGMRRVRMVGAEHWTETPERELPTIAAGGDTYAVHERICIDSARVRLVLAEGEDVAAALREVYGEAVRDVRVFRLVEGGGDVVEGLPEWRLTLPLSDDAVHDPLPGMITRLAGAVAEPQPVVEESVAVEPILAEAALIEVPVLEVPVLEEPVLEEPALLEAPADVVPVLEPADAVPTLEPEPEHEPAPFVLPVGLVMPELAAPDAVVEEVAPIEVPAEPEQLADAELLAAAAAAAAAVADEPAAHDEPAADALAPHDDPFAMPAETVFPTEAAEVEVAGGRRHRGLDEPVEELVDEVVAEDAVIEEPVAEEVEAVEVVTEEPVAEVVPEPEPEPSPSLSPTRATWPSQPWRRSSRSVARPAPPSTGTARAPRRPTSCGRRPRVPPGPAPGTGRAPWPATPAPRWAPCTPPVPGRPGATATPSTSPVRARTCSPTPRAATSTRWRDRWWRSTGSTRC